MVKIIPKESDSILTLPSEDSSLECVEGQQGDARTITKLIEHIPRSLATKQSKACSHEITSRKWSPKETVHFYKMLEVVGTDFSMMSHMQSRRSKK